MHCLFFGIERNDRQHRTKNLFTFNGHSGAHICEDRRLDVVAAVETFGQTGASGNKTRSFVDALLDIALDDIPLAFVHDRPNMAARFMR